MPITKNYQIRKLPFKSKTHANHDNRKHTSTSFPRTIIAFAQNSIAGIGTLVFVNDSNTPLKF